MKSWHVTVIDHTKTVRHKEFFDVKESRKVYEEWKAEFAESNPKFMVLREEYDARK